MEKKMDLYPQAIIACIILYAIYSLLGKVVFEWKSLDASSYGNESNQDVKSE